VKKEERKMAEQSLPFWQAEHKPLSRLALPASCHEPPLI
jgi:hypothetical protein